jgi:uncharacterized protein
MIKFSLIICLILSFKVNTQVILKENLTKKTTFYYDFLKTKPQARGSYYKDLLGETTMKHGKWEYYDEKENIIEIRNYFTDKLNGNVSLFFPNGKLRQEGYFKDDLQDSVYREWYENGKLALDCTYKSGQLKGIKKSFYLDGRDQGIEEYIDTTRYVWSFWLPDSLHTQTIIEGNGEMTTYFPTGTVKEWCNYKKGLPDGECLERSIYGYDILAGSFKEGVKVGTWKYYYYTGKIEKIANYENGKLTGKYQYFYDNGQINAEGFYKDGLKSGEWTWYTKQGNRDIQGNFSEGKQDGKWTYWYPTGELSYTAAYKQDKKEGVWTYYYKNGVKFKEGSFLNDEKNGKWETFYENGVLLMYGDYLDGKEEGEWFNFWDNAVIKNKATFKKGTLNGNWYSHFPNGDLKLMGKYKNGDKTGKWTEYFEGNKPKDVLTYKVIKHKSKVKYGPMKGRVSYESVKHGQSISYSSKDFKKTEEGNFKNGLKDGEWIAYFPGGKMPANITSYKKGELDGTMKEFDRKGELISEIEYKAGLKHGKMKVYNKKGKVVVEKKFAFGLEVTKGSGNFSPK